MWQRQIIQTVRNSLRSSERELKRAVRGDRLDPTSRDLADRFVGRADDLVDHFQPLVGERVDARRIRIHGDLHLGQVLWTGHDVVFIDFEGEPGQPMGQRTIKRSPLGDVAGLLRSFDYAGRVAVHTAVERGQLGEAARPDADRWRRAWTAATRRALLDAYRSTIAGTDLVPDGDTEFRLLLDVYLATKCAYEVRYELANRPDWVAWPLSALVELLDRGASS
jgi:maltose alpha-D-glucosyltransferase/alpha-amylase